MSITGIERKDLADTVWMNCPRSAEGTCWFTCQSTPSCCSLGETIYERAGWLVWYRRERERLQAAEFCEVPA